MLEEIRFKMSRIPKKLHFIWVGDESIRPDAFIETWRRQHPDFEVRVWGNDDWKGRKWVNRRHMDRICEESRGYAAVADLMRWEILLDEGGFALDADSVCLQRLPDWLFDCDLFAVWENEYSRPGLIANGYVGAAPGNDVIRAVIDELQAINDISRRFIWYKLKRKRRKVWQTTGPVPFTRAVLNAEKKTATILPSHFFLPKHHGGEVFAGHGPVYSCEYFAGTLSTYETMKGYDPDTLVEKVRRELNESLRKASES